MGVGRPKDERSAGMNKAETWLSIHWRPRLPGMNTQSEHIAKQTKTNVD